MGKILEALLSEQLHVTSKIEKRSAEHQQLCEKADELQIKLAEKLDAEEKEMLTELMETRFEAGCHNEQRQLERGFRLGVLLTTEIFTERGTYL